MLRIDGTLASSALDPLGGERPSEAVSPLGT
jgi:hypothetical protein